MIILDGKKTAKRILDRMKKGIERKNLKLKLAAVSVGSNKVSEIYIGRKKKACEEVGIAFELLRYPRNIKEEELKAEISKISDDPEFSGIIVQLPLSKRINAQNILDAVAKEKDIDVLSERSLGAFYSGSSKVSPPVVSAVSILLREYKINVNGKNVLVIGTGRLVGKPLVVWLMREGATVSAANSKTKDVSLFSKKADIIISGVGKPGLITRTMLKKGVVLLDAGTTIEGGTLKGDIDFESVKNIASFIAPVPGGIGPMTVACLIRNLIDLNNK